MTDICSKMSVDLDAGEANRTLSQSRSSLPDVEVPTDLNEIIEDLRRRNEELIRVNAALTEELASRDAFLAVAAHELRNPMTPILGRVQLLRRTMSKQEFRPELIGRGLEQIEWLMDQFVKRATILLDVSRIAAGKLRLEPARVEVCALVRQVVEGLAPLLEHAKAPLSIACPDEEIVGTFDPLALEQILNNLISNAIKYGDGQPISVTVTNEAEAGLVVIRVRDSGPGISIENQARIFERFERAARHGVGFGVGLWIVRQLAEAMDGTVEIDSTSGAGATFIVTLPIRTDKDSHERGQQTRL